MFVYIEESKKQTKINDRITENNGRKTLFPISFGTSCFFDPAKHTVFLLILLSFRTGSNDSTYFFSLCVVPLTIIDFVSGPSFLAQVSTCNPDRYLFGIFTANQYFSHRLIFCASLCVCKAKDFHCDHSVYFTCVANVPERARARNVHVCVCESMSLLVLVTRMAIALTRLWAPNSNKPK